MFINTKYKKHYDRLCENARQRQSVRGYFEKHHIVPKSLGGGNDPSNIVHFTAREHYIAHKLLTKITEGVDRVKMVNAFFRMNIQGDNPEYKFVNSYRFELARKAFSKVAGWNTRGRTYEDLHGLEKAKELRLMRAAHKSKERKGKSWEDIFGKEKALELKLLRGQQARMWNKGRIASEETKKKISNSKKGKKVEKTRCPLCDNHYGVNNIKQHLLRCQRLKETAQK